MCKFFRKCSSELLSSIELCIHHFKLKKILLFIARSLQSAVFSLNSPNSNMVTEPHWYLLGQSVRTVALCTFDVWYKFKVFSFSIHVRTAYMLHVIVTCLSSIFAVKFECSYFIFSLVFNVVADRKWYMNMKVPVHRISLPTNRTETSS